MSHHLGMDEFIIFILMTNNRMSLLEIFPKNVHVYFVTMLVAFLGNHGAYVQCKHVYHILQAIMFDGFMESSFITARGIGMKFNVCYYILKPLNFNDNTSQLHLHQINCDFFIDKTCCSSLDYVRSLDFGYDLKVFFIVYYFNHSR